MLAATPFIYHIHMLIPQFSTKSKKLLSNTPSHFPLFFTSHFIILKTLSIYSLWYFPAPKSSLQLSVTPISLNLSLLSLVQFSLVKYQFHKLSHSTILVLHFFFIISSRTSSIKLCIHSLLLETY